MNNLKEIGFMINGTKYLAAVEPSLTLLELLRERLELTGTKKGCDNGDCGVCTVLKDGKPILACLLLAFEAEGSEITTIEGLRTNKKLHPIQQAFVDAGAIQCGYCTPGMVMAAKGLLDEEKDPDEKNIREAISGHICRCTGYDNIVKAIKNASGQEMGGKGGA